MLLVALLGAVAFWFVRRRESAAAEVPSGFVRWQDMGLDPAHLTHLDPMVGLAMADREVAALDRNAELFAIVVERPALDGTVNLAGPFTGHISYRFKTHQRIDDEPGVCLAYNVRSEPSRGGFAISTQARASCGWPPILPPACALSGALATMPAGGKIRQARYQSVPGSPARPPLAGYWTLELQGTVLATDDACRPIPVPRWVGLAN